MPKFVAIGYGDRGGAIRHRTRRPATRLSIMTCQGQAEALFIRAAIEEHARAMEGLFAETGVDLVAVLDDALEALRIKSLKNRVGELSITHARAA